MEVTYSSRFKRIYFEVENYLKDLKQISDDKKISPIKKQFLLKKYYKLLIKSVKKDIMIHYLSKDEARILGNIIRNSIKTNQFDFIISETKFSQKDIDDFIHVYHKKNYFRQVLKAKYDKYRIYHTNYFHFQDIDLLSNEIYSSLIKSYNTFIELLHKYQNGNCDNKIILELVRNYDSFNQKIRKIINCLKKTTCSNNKYNIILDGYIKILEKMQSCFISRYKIVDNIFYQEEDNNVIKTKLEDIMNNDKIGDAIEWFGCSSKERIQNQYNDKLDDILEEVEEARNCYQERKSKYTSLWKEAISYFKVKKVKRVKKRIYSTYLGEVAIIKGL